jgi:hypothetical protein
MDARSSRLKTASTDEAKRTEEEAEENRVMSLDAGAAWDVSGDYALGLSLDETGEAMSESGTRVTTTAIQAVTLIVYGWKIVEPGTLWWVFPSVAAALAAAHAMTNAVKWAIVQGPPRGAIVDIARARAAGAVLVEQTA